MDKCRDCGCKDDDVAYSVVFGCFLCDGCYTDLNDRIEDESKMEQAAREYGR